MNKAIFLLVIFLIPLTPALQFSPTSLVFNLDPSETSCKEIHLNIESPATVQDSWAEDFSASWSITGFKTASQEHSLEIEYPSQVDNNDNKIQVCLSGEQSGNYKGALIFQQEKVGNSIVQFAVWIKVNIEGEASSEEQEDQSKTKKSSSSRSGSSSFNQATPANESITYQNLNQEKPEEEIILNNLPLQEKSHVLGTTPIILMITTTLFMILLLFLLVRKKPF